MNSQAKGILFFEILKYLLGKLLKKFKTHKRFPEAERRVRKKVSEVQLMVAGAVCLYIVHAQKPGHTYLQSATYFHSYQPSAAHWQANR